MNQRFFTLLRHGLIVALSAGAVLTAAHAHPTTPVPDDAKVRAEVTDYYGRVRQAVAQRDVTSLKALYTEAVKIYLTDVPSFSLMYRPDKFHAVNESVWTNFPDSEDGRNIPPTNCTDGYGIAALYDVELVNP